MRFRVALTISIFLTSFVLYVLYQRLVREYRKIESQQIGHRHIERHFSQPTLHVAVVACGQRQHEILVMIKSAILFNHSKELLRFLVFADDNLIPSLREKFTDWRSLLPLQFDFELLPLHFPQNSETEWRSMFKPCAAQRLFLPSVLQAVDALLYVDTDIIFLSPVADIWRFFSRFNTTQIAALTPEHEDENIGWYNRFARHPYYGHLGVNSGVMLMNLTRMRDFDWEAHVFPIHKEYKLRITWGDQDIINILFYYHPERLYIMPCEYNYRPDHCMYMSVCNASTAGIKMLHGNRGYFHSDKQPLFRVLYEAVESYQLGTNVYSNFILPLQVALEDPAITESSCGKMSKETLLVAKQIFVHEYNYTS